MWMCIVDLEKFGSKLLTEKAYVLRNNPSEIDVYQALPFSGTIQRDSY